MPNAICDSLAIGFLAFSQTSKFTAFFAEKQPYQTGKQSRSWPDLPPVLLIRNMLHPIHKPALKSLLDGNMRHRRTPRCSMPMLFPRPEPDHVPWMDLLDCIPRPLHPPAARRDDQRLPQGMRMPGGPSSGFKSHARSSHRRRVGCLKQRIDPHHTRKPLRRACHRRLGANAFNLHLPMLPTPRLQRDTARKSAYLEASSKPPTSASTATGG